MLAGIAGASLSIALINLFQENMTNGMGFIAVALVYFGGWRPMGVLGGALLFSLVNALQLWIQVKGHRPAVRYRRDAALYPDHSGAGFLRAPRPAAGCAHQAF